MHQSPQHTLSALVSLLSGSLLGLCLTSCERSAAPTTPRAPRYVIPVASASKSAPAQPASAKEHAPAQATPAAPDWPALPESFARQHACEEGICPLNQWLPDPRFALTPHEQVPSRTALWVQRLAAKARIELPAHPELELVAVALEGALSARDLMRHETTEPLALEPWSALRAPGAGIELRCEAAPCSAMLALVSTAPLLEAALAARPRRAPMAAKQRELELRSFGASPVYSWNQGKSHARIVFGGEDPKAPPDQSLPFSLTLLGAAAGVSIPPHTHADAWESLLVLQADGELELRGRPYPLSGGEAIVVMPKVRHGYAAAGARPMAALQLYTPAGPERRFMEAARAEAQTQTTDR